MAEPSGPETPPPTIDSSHVLLRMEPPALDVAAYCSVIHNNIRNILGDPVRNPWEADSYEEAAKRSDFRISELKRNHDRIKVLQKREEACMSLVIQHLADLEHYCAWLPRGTDGKRSDKPPRGPMPSASPSASTVTDLGNGLAEMNIVSQRHKATISQSAPDDPYRGSPYSKYADESAPDYTGAAYESRMRDILREVTGSPGLLSSSGSEDGSPLPPGQPRSTPAFPDLDAFLALPPSSSAIPKGPVNPPAPTYGEALTWIEGGLGTQEWWTVARAAFEKQKSLRETEGKIRVNQMLIFGTEKELIDAIIWCGETRKEAEMRHLSFNPPEE